jgi:hypothetical protein
MVVEPGFLLSVIRTPRNMKACDYTFAPFRTSRDWRSMQTATYMVPQMRAVRSKAEWCFS